MENSCPPKSKETLDFIERANKVHNSRYCYDEVDYIKNTLKITIKCKEHNNVFTQTPSLHLRGYLGCKGCSVQKRKHTVLSRYGVENSLQSEKTIQKTKDTLVKRYGVENPMQCEHIKQKRKDTILQRYGVEHPMQCERVKQKMKNTILQRYGVENPMHCEHIKAKHKKACNPEKFTVDKVFKEISQQEQKSTPLFKDSEIFEKIRKLDMKRKILISLLGYSLVQNQNQNQNILPPILSLI